MSENSSNIFRVLAVDDDLVSLKILSCKLQQCGYKVTATTKPTEALAILNDDKDGFDIVLTDIMMPDIDGFKLLEIIRKINIPVIMISADTNTKTVVKGIKSGAQDYLEKPVQVEDLKRIIPEYAKKKPQSSEKCNEDETTKLYEIECYQNGSPQKQKEIETESDQNGSPLKKHKIETESDQNGSPQKKRRTIWTPYLHTKFLKAIKQIEASNESDTRIIPTKILQIMNEPDLTRESVASHLQKYRKGAIKKGGSNGDDYNEQDPVSSPELTHATENFLHRNGQYELNGFGSGSVNNPNRIFTYSANQSYMFPSANMLPQNYLHSSQMYPNLISSPMISNGYGSQILKPEITNDIPFNNAYQIPYFGSNQIPSRSSFVSIHPNQFGHPLPEITPYTQSPNVFTSDFQMHRGFSPLQQVPSSLQGQHDAQNECFSMNENPIFAEENGCSSNITCDIMNSFIKNEQPKQTEHTHYHPNVQAIDRQNSFGLDDEIRTLLV